MPMLFAVNWYGRAAVCIIYLAETTMIPDMHLDPWFRRGWTLQELLAPNIIKFYNNHWMQLIDSSENDKRTAETIEQIERATTLSINELNSIRYHSSISRRMQLAAARVVTREEDTAYSLMGIFNVSMSIAYGEGAERAFSRLLQEILVTSEEVLDILNWAGELPASLPYNSHILPTSPTYYINRSSDERLRLGQPTEPLTLTQLGLCVPFVLMPGISIPNITSRYDSIGDYYAIVEISPIERHKDFLSTHYNLLDNRISGKDGPKEDDSCYQITFAVFNFTAASNIIHLPRTCIAICLICFGDAGKVSNGGGIQNIETDKAVVFELSKRRTTDEEEDVNLKTTDGEEIANLEVADDGKTADLEAAGCWDINTEELAKHGMQLINLHL